MRERGLKPAGGGVMVWQMQVAPYAGAWIETQMDRISLTNKDVAPYAGAWIETGGRKWGG